MRQHVEKLLSGESVTFKPRGNSMTPKIISGQQVTVVPISDKSLLLKGDVVLCKVHGNYYLHIIHAIDIPVGKCLIGNNHGHMNGWTPFSNVFGILSK